MKFENTKHFADALDEDDLLAPLRDQFYIPMINGKDAIYFTGNSLGLQPKATQEYVLDELEDWASFGVEGHFHAKNPWKNYHEMFPPIISKIVGCEEHEVVVMNQLTVNIHLLFATFYRPTRQRFKIICEAKAFPSDQYALQSQIELAGLDVTDTLIEVVPREGEHCIRTEDIISTINEHGDSLALVFIGGVNYYTGQVFDMESVTQAAHETGAYCGFDLAHAIGNVRLELHEWKVDFATWCSYKYLNSGPGGVSGIYINETHARNTELPRMAGWWGQEKETRFLMEPNFKPIPTAEGWQLSNAPILSMAVHKASLDLFDSVGMELIIAKGNLLQEFLCFIIDDINQKNGQKIIDIITPREKGAHGCQVSMIMLQNGKKIFDELSKQGVISDWREPDVIRIAPVAMYNSFMDVYEFGRILEVIIRQQIDNE